MDHARVSQTAIRVAAMRAVHQLIDGEPKILRDPIAVGLIREASDEVLRAELATHEKPTKRYLRANFVLRSRFAEDHLEEAARRGIRQYIVLGAGLDTFGYRQPVWASGLTIVEIDHPASQQFKIENLARAGITVPGNVRFLPIDFAVDAVADKLAAAPLDSARPIFVSWLGVTQYLGHDDISATLRALASWAGGGEVALTYIDSDWCALSADEVAAMKIGETRAAASGEPWVSRFSEAGIADLLAASGFSCIEHLSISTADAVYFSGRRDQLRPSRGIGLTHAKWQIHHPQC